MNSAMISKILKIEIGGGEIQGTVGVDVALL